MNKFIFLASLLLILPFVSAEIELGVFQDIPSVRLGVEPSTFAGPPSNSTFNQTLGDSIWRRIDGTNSPSTGDWDNAEYSLNFFNSQLNTGLHWSSGSGNVDVYDTTAGLIISSYSTLFLRSGDKIIDTFGQNIQATTGNITAANLCYANGTNCMSSSGFTTNQNNELNTTGNATFNKINLGASSQQIRLDYDSANAVTTLTDSTTTNITITFPNIQGTLMSLAGTQTVTGDKLFSGDVNLTKASGNALTIDSIFPGITLVDRSIDAFNPGGVRISSTGNFFSIEDYANPGIFVYSYNSSTGNIAIGETITVPEIALLTSDRLNVSVGGVQRFLVNATAAYSSNPFASSGQIGLTGTYTYQCGSVLSLGILTNKFFNQTFTGGILTGNTTCI